VFIRNADVIFSIDYLFQQSFHGYIIITTTTTTIIIIIYSVKNK